MSGCQAEKLSFQVKEDTKQDLKSDTLPALLVVAQFLPRWVAPQPPAWPPPAASPLLSSRPP